MIPFQIKMLLYGKKNGLKLRHYWMEEVCTQYVRQNINIQIYNVLKNKYYGLEGTYGLESTVDRVLVLNVGDLIPMPVTLFIPSASSETRSQHTSHNNLSSTKCDQQQKQINVNKFNNTIKIQ